MKTRLVCVLASVLLACAALPLRADDIVLPAKTHREVWHGGSGNVIKDFEWSVNATVSASAGSLTVGVGEKVTRHADAFAGVVGEMDFADDALRSIDVTFADGETRHADGSQLRLEGDAANRTVTKVAANFELVGRKWTLSWDAHAAADEGTKAQLPPDWSQATSEPPVVTVENVPTKGTWLTPTELKNRPQDVVGLWTTDENGAPGEVRWFELQDQQLVVHSLLEKNGAWARLAKQGDANRWEGTGAAPGQAGTGFFTVPMPKGTCPQLAKWSAGHLQLDSSGLRFTGEWHDRKIDATKCEFTDEPNASDEAFDRYIGVAFVPIKPGKYLYLGMAPAVGSQPAQFKALVRLASRYDGLSGTQVKTSVAPATATLTRTAGTDLAGAYEFTASAHGTYELTFQLVDAAGVQLHTDRLRIEIPTVPGIGN